MRIRILTRYILGEVVSHALIGAAVFTFILFTRDLGRMAAVFHAAGGGLASLLERPGLRQSGRRDPAVASGGQC